jgi:RNA polymerase sigma-70 factor (family 1)
MIKIEESILTDRIKQGDSSAFSIVFTHYYADLVIFANTFIRDKETSEEIVQDIFIKLWENRDKITITTSLKSFLLKSVQNKSIDRLRHLKIRNKYQSMILDHPILFENNTENFMLYSELEKSLETALNKMPDEVTNTFSLSRFEGFTYNEIAEKLNISVRTVEVRVSKALVLLREQLKDYLFIFLCGLWFFK